MKKAFIISMIAAPMLAAILVSIHLSILFYTPYSGDTTHFQITPGEGFSSINYRLAKKEIISNARLFHYYVKYKDLLSSFQAGTFEIKQGSHMGDILNLLVFGAPLLESVTIPEGKNIYQIADLLDEKKITTKEEFLKEVKAKENIQLLGIEAESLEGYLFPDTYKFAPLTPATTVIKTLLEQFYQKTKTINFTHPFLSKHEIIILASVVEKETGAKFERPTIAGVFLNRLKKKMRLQSDPTTIYGIYETYNGNLKKSHLQEFTPYNTYKIPALPIGPICNPSLEAIQAVLNPESHDYLYFVSKNDGTHIFSKTYKDHNDAVTEWQKNPANRKGRSWRDLKQ
jgi:UPF0755 protein